MRSARVAPHLAQRDEPRLELLACRTGAGRGCASRRRPRPRSARRRERRARRARRPPRCASAMPSSVSWSVSAIAASPTRLRLAHDVGRRARSVGRGGVRVQVDEGAAPSPARESAPSRRVVGFGRRVARLRVARTGAADRRRVSSTSELLARARADRRIAGDAHLAAGAGAAARRSARTRRGRTA